MADFPATITSLVPPVVSPNPIGPVIRGDNIIWTNATSEKVRLKDFLPITHPPLFSGSGFPIDPGKSHKAEVLATPTTQKEYTYKYGPDTTPVALTGDGDGIIVVDPPGGPKPKKHPRKAKSSTRKKAAPKRKAKAKPKARPKGKGKKKAAPKRKAKKPSRRKRY